MVIKKKVNIQSQYPLYVFTPPLTGVINGAELTYPEIYNCLGQGAIINEILEDGSELRLTYKNYNVVNVPKFKTVKEDKVILPDPSIIDGQVEPIEPTDEDAEPVEPIDEDTEPIEPTDEDTEPVDEDAEPVESIDEDTEPIEPTDEDTEPVDEDTEPDEPIVESVEPAVEEVKVDAHTKAKTKNKNGKRK